MTGPESTQILRIETFILGKTLKEAGTGKSGETNPNLWKSIIFGLPWNGFTCGICFMFLRCTSRLVTFVVRMVHLELKTDGKIDPSLSLSLYLYLSFR